MGDGVVEGQNNKTKGLNVSNHTLRRNKNSVIVPYIVIGIVFIILGSFFIIYLLDDNGPYAINGGEELIEDLETVIQKEPEENDKKDNLDGPHNDIVFVDVPDTTFLYLRSGSGTNYTSLDQLYRGTKLKVINDARCSEGDLWLQVITPAGKEGWVHGEYVISQEELSTHTEKPYSGEEFGLESIGLQVGYSIEEVISILGEPTKTEREVNGLRGQTTSLLYDGLMLGFYHEDYLPSLEPTDSYLGYYTIYSSDIIGKRGIRVGDTAESVMEKYLKDSDVPGELYYLEVSDGFAKSGGYHRDHNSGIITEIYYWYGVPETCHQTIVTYTIENGLVNAIKMWY